MLYSILKTIIETTIVQYICQSCQWKIDENSVTVGETTDNQIHLDIHCPHCESHAHIHAEVANVNSQIIHTKNGWLAPSIMPKNENAIKDADIRAISDNIGNIRSVEDLLR
jgi:DNA-directed RNA polymerase subunit RPC12/RpoP